MASLVDALEASNVQYTDFKLLTTPQLHYLVRCENTKGTQYAYGDVSEKGYYEKLAAAFKNAMQGKKIPGSVTVDCANGVGGPKLRELMKYLPSPAEGGLEIRVVNDDVLKPENLNMQVCYSSVQPMLATKPCISAELTMSKLNNEHHRHPKRTQETVVPLWTEMQTVWFTTSSHRKTLLSTFLTATELLLWLPHFFLISLEPLACRKSWLSVLSRLPTLMVQLHTMLQII